MKEVVEVLLNTVYWIILVGLVAYVKKKAEDLARTKENVAEITKKIELVHGEKEVKLFIYKIRYQHEFIVLRKLYEKLIHFRNNTFSIMNMSNIDEEGKKQILIKCHQSAIELNGIFEQNRPFYPEEIYDIWVNKIRKLMGIEIICSLKENCDQKYFNKTIKNQKVISGVIDEIMNLIKDRLKNWENFILRD